MVLRTINTLLAVVLLIFITTTNARSSEVEKEYYFYNKNGLYVWLYSTVEECIQQGTTDSYLLNGFVIGAANIVKHELFVEIHIADHVLYCNPNYLVNVSPHILNSRIT